MDAMNPVISILGIDTRSICTIITQGSDYLDAQGPQGPEAIWTVDCYGNPDVSDDDFIMDVDTSRKQLVFYAAIGELSKCDKRPDNFQAPSPDAAAIESARLAAQQFFQAAGILDVYTEWSRAETQFRSDSGWVHVSVQRYVNGIPCMSSVYADIDPANSHIVRFGSGTFFPLTSTAYVVTEQEARVLAEAFIGQLIGNHIVSSTKLIIVQPNTRGMVPLEECPLEMRVCWFCKFEDVGDGYYASVEVDANTRNIIGYDCTYQLE
jgi:hypothetical protein